MKAYPINISIPAYRGKDPKKRAECNARVEAARAIQDFINGQMKDNPGGTTREFDCGEIAAALSITRETVKAILYHYDGSSNGVTVGKPINE